MANRRRRQSEHEVVRPVPQLRMGKPDSTLTYVDGTESVVCSIWTGKPGAETDSGINLTVYCRLLQAGESIASGLWVDLGLINGYWQIINVQCP